jgi:hypothetical protein
MLHLGSLGLILELAIAEPVVLTLPWIRESRNDLVFSLLKKI